MKTPEESLGISSEKYNDIVNQGLYGESQFKVGDWVICTDDEETISIKKIIKFYDNKVKLVDTNGTYVVFPKSELKYYHLWSIADARRGDVLVSPLSIFIFKRVYMAGKPEAYCGLMVDTDDFIIREPGCWTNNKCWPATKEQRERLFSKMLKSGYKWDVKNKELIPLQPVSKPSEVVWSDEDDKILQGVIDEIQANKSSAPEYDLKTYDKFLSWLESLKEKIGG